MNVRTLLATLLLSLCSGMAIAGNSVALPEPGVIELLAIGAVAGIAVAIRNRRNRRK